MPEKAPGARPTRSYNVWSTVEEEALRNGVKKHGLGAWEVIRKDPSFSVLEHRSGVQLKDKFRNLVKFRHISVEESKKLKPKGSGPWSRKYSSTGPASRERSPGYCQPSGLDEHSSLEPLASTHETHEHAEALLALERASAPPGPGMACLGPPLMLPYTSPLALPPPLSSLAPYDTLSEEDPGGRGLSRSQRKRRRSQENTRFGIYDQRRYNADGVECTGMYGGPDDGRWGRSRSGRRGRREGESDDTMTEESSDEYMGAENTTADTEDEFDGNGALRMQSLPANGPRRERSTRAAAKKQKELLQKELRHLRDEYRVRCPCGVREDDGAMMIECEGCKDWAHVDCLQHQMIYSPETHVYDFSNYWCFECQQERNLKQQAAAAAALQPLCLPPLPAMNHPGMGKLQYVGGLPFSSLATQPLSGCQLGPLGLPGPLGACPQGQEVVHELSSLLLGLSQGNGLSSGSQGQLEGSEEAAAEGTAAGGRPGAAAAHLQGRGMEQCLALGQVQEVGGSGLRTISTAGPRGARGPAGAAGARAGGPSGQEAAGGVQLAVGLGGTLGDGGPFSDDMVDSLSHFFMAHTRGGCVPPSGGGSGQHGLSGHALAVSPRGYGPSAATGLTSQRSGNLSPPAPIAAMAAQARLERLTGGGGSSGGEGPRGWLGPVGGGGGVGRLRSSHSHSHPHSLSHLPASDSHLHLEQLLAVASAPSPVATDTHAAAALAATRLGSVGSDGRMSPNPLGMLKRAGSLGQPGHHHHHTPGFGSHGAGGGGGGHPPRAPSRGPPLTFPLGCSDGGLPSAGGGALFGDTEEALVALALGLDPQCRPESALMHILNSRAPTPSQLLFVDSFLRGTTPDIANAPLLHERPGNSGATAAAASGHLPAHLNHLNHHHAPSNLGPGGGAVVTTASGVGAVTAGKANGQGILGFGPYPQALLAAGGALGPGSAATGCRGIELKAEPTNTAAMQSAREELARLASTPHALPRAPSPALPSGPPTTSLPTGSRPPASLPLSPLAPLSSSGGPGGIDKEGGGGGGGQEGEGGVSSLGDPWGLMRGPGGAGGEPDNLGLPSGFPLAALGHSDFVANAQWLLQRTTPPPAPVPELLALAAQHQLQLAAQQLAAQGQQRGVKHAQQQGGGVSGQGIDRPPPGFAQGQDQGKAVEAGQAAEGLGLQPMGQQPDPCEGQQGQGQQGQGQDQQGQGPGKKRGKEGQGQAGGQGQASHASHQLPCGPGLALATALTLSPSEGLEERPAVSTQPSHNQEAIEVVEARRRSGDSAKMVHGSFAQGSSTALPVAGGAGTAPNGQPNAPSAEVADAGAPCALQSKASLGLLSLPYTTGSAAGQHGNCQGPNSGSSVPEEGYFNVEDMLRSNTPALR